MSIFLLLIGVLAVVGVVGTLLSLRNDGLRRVPSAPVLRDARGARWQ